MRDQTQSIRLFFSLVILIHNASIFCFPSFSDENSKNVCAQYLITSETNTAALGDLNHILNLDNETICIKFETEPGS